MSTYCYSPLSIGANNIRLLRLSPYTSRNAETTELRGEIFEYSLHNLSRGTHLYEALSYTWSGDEKPFSITIDEQSLPITANLHAALMHLRDRYLERLVWIDAICINQSNREERSQQVQLMAMIYSKAHRVLVWLGENGDDVEGALETIQGAADEDSTENSNKPIERKVISNLLRRPWFQRIWVLQEVAAARHVVMMCGSSEIDGYAFCLGLRSLRKSQSLSNTDLPELPSLTSLTNLIERTGIRPKRTTNSLDQYSLKIRPLAELIDMFLTRKASDPHDKVYALLGMSSDDKGKVSLEPNYKMSWDVLFQQLVHFIIGKDVTVETYGLMAVINTKGKILGHVASVRIDDRQIVTVTPKDKTWIRSDKIKWTLHVSAKPVQEYDIVCLLRGALKPTIIRLCKDHFDIIMIAVTPLIGVTPLSAKDSASWTERHYAVDHSLLSFSLAWDWGHYLENLQHQENYKVLTKPYNESLEYPTTALDVYLGEARKLWEIIMILDEVGVYKRADRKLLEAVSGCKTALRERLFLKPSDQYGRTPLSFIAGEGHEAIMKLLLRTFVPDLRDRKDGRTPLSWAAGNGQTSVVRLLLSTSGVDIDSKDKNGRTPLSWATGNGQEDVVKILLNSKVSIDLEDRVGEAPLVWAAKNGHEAVVKLLLDTCTVVNYGPCLWQAAKNGHEAVVRLLVDTDMLFYASIVSGNLVDWHDMSLSIATRHGHKGVVTILKDRKSELDFLMFDIKYAR